MMQLFDHIQYQGKMVSSYRSFIYGPVCIDRLRRGRGVLRGLFEMLRREVTKQYEVGVAFVSKENPRSLAAHVDGFGMARVGEFEFGRHEDEMLAFSVVVGDDGQSALRQ
ncbi:MAG: hypothetical protein ACE5JD_14535 [Candidatus Methylomirabilia bacterium]